MSAIEFQRSRNSELIRFILTEPKCYIRMKNDMAPAPEDLPVGPISGIEYVIATRQGTPVALFLLSDAGCAPGVSEVHFCFLPKEWGETYHVCCEFLRWVWRHTSLRLLKGNVPGYNALALRLAKAVGFEEKGKIVAGVQKNRRNYDVILTVLERPNGRMDKIFDYGGNYAERLAGNAVTGEIWTGSKA